METKSPPNSRSRGPLTWLSIAVAAVLVGMVRLYQFTLRPILGGRCRFEPCCSEYFIGAVNKYGPWKGALKGVWRICRCQPFCQGGDDPP